MSSSIFQKIHDANLDKELEIILIKLLRYNMTSVVEIPISNFLQEYIIIQEDFWTRFNGSNSIEIAFESYFQYTKIKCILVDSLLDNLNLALNNDPIRKELTLMLKEGFTF